MAEPVVYYRDVNLEELQFEEIRKEGSVYVVGLTRPLLIQAPPTTLVSALDEGVTFAYLAPVGQFAAFLKGVETAVLDACLANKGAWFRREIDDEALRCSFKSFFRPNGTIKVQAPEDLLVFGPDRQLASRHDIQAGSPVRAILELHKIVFGKTEFGAMWTAVQLQAAAVPKCLIDDTVDGAPSSHGDDDVLHEFV